ncbi:hypothetical protein M3Y96_00637600 [Aphelenchoides besseyi]|nr:hypothetical protein M3Y96_00637600 [Aphelenchoides besseyi]
MIAINAQNPFVYDENHFSGRTNHSFADTSFAMIHRINNLLSGVIGISASLLIIYLIYYKTPIYFRTYSRMILFCAAADAVFVLSDLWCQFRIKIVGTIVLGSYSGPAKHLQPTGQCFSMVIQAIGPQVTCLTLPINCYFRYHTIKHQRPPSQLQMTKLLGLMVVTLFILSLPVVPIGCSWLVSNESLPNLGPLWYNETPIPFLITADIRHISTLIFLGCFLTILSSAYILSLYMAQKTVIELKKKASEITAKATAIHSQLSWTLFLQSISPLVTSLLPLACIVFMLIADIESEYMGDLIMLAVSWSPVLSSLSVLYVIKPYRLYCIRLLNCGQKKNYLTVFPNMSSFKLPPADAPIVEHHKYKKRKKRVHHASLTVVVISLLIWVAMVISDVILEKWMEMVFSIFLLCCCILLLICKLIPKKTHLGHAIFLILHALHIAYIVIELIVNYVLEFNHLYGKYSREQLNGEFEHKHLNYKMVLMDAMKLVFVVVRVIIGVIVYADFKYLSEEIHRDDN